MRDRFSEKRGGNETSFPTHHWSPVTSSEMEAGAQMFRGLKKGGGIKQLETNPGVRLVMLNQLWDVLTVCCLNGHQVTHTHTDRFHLLVLTTLASSY